MRDQLTAITGRNMQPFFKDWILGPGYAHFSIDSFKVIPTPGMNTLEVFIHQKKRGSNHYFTEVPLTITVYDDQFNVDDVQMKVSGEFTKLSITTLLHPILVELNVDDALNMAVTADQVMMNASQSYVFKNGKMNVDVTNLPSDALLRVEHHWAAPDKIVDQAAGFNISDYRYWRVSGIFPDNFEAQANIFFDGRNFTSGGNGNLDVDLLKNGTDSVVLLYRRHAGEDWKEYKYYSKTVFGTQKFGRMDLSKLLGGQYALANGISSLAVIENANEKWKYSIVPNPATDQVQFIGPKDDTVAKQIVIYNSSGREIYRENFSHRIELNSSKWKSGSYFASIFMQNKMIWSGQFIISR
jgi:aminopeptidase N